MARPITATFEGLPDRTLSLRGFSGSEEMSRLFQFELDLESTATAIRFADVVRKRATIRLALPSGGWRVWNGYIRRFSQGLVDGYLTSYRAELVPWLWLLTRRANCRIFQDEDVPSIVRKVFEEAGFAGQFEYRLYGEFVKRDYCVQYRETDFHFVSRLLEEEGITYFFQHRENEHILVLANGPAAHKVCGVQGCYSAVGGSLSHGVIQHWSHEEEICSGKFSARDFNMETSDADLSVSREATGEEQGGEVYDYPGEYSDAAAGDRLAKVRLEDQQSQRIMAHGRGCCHEFAAGYTFELREHYRRDLNREYLLLAMHHTVRRVANRSQSEAEPAIEYENRFTCVPFPANYRPARVTPKAVIRGCQTAIVTAPPGEEIYTDNYGRIKVRFHWDRDKQPDEYSSCWIRVAQAWAGHNWGAVAIPRAGQEVIVEFLEGNPDRPIITGAVYNASQMPPYALPREADIMGIRSNSTKGGGGYNEVALLDRKGDELVRIHAQRDMDTIVLHDQKELVHENKKVHVLRDLRTDVGQNASLAVDGDAVQNIRGTHSELVGGERLLKAGRVVIEADQEIEIKVGGNNIRVNAAGVFIDGQKWSI